MSLQWRVAVRMNHKTCCGDSRANQTARSLWLMARAYAPMPTCAGRGVSENTSLPRTTRPRGPCASLLHAVQKTVAPSHNCIYDYPNGTRIMIIRKFGNVTIKITVIYEVTSLQ